MKQTDIFYPFLAMMVLTLCVWAYMYVLRIGYMIGNRIRPADLATSEAVGKVLPERINYPSHNLKNLFELPVLFYALCLFLFVTDQVNVVYLYSACIFVAFRALHSLVHCTVNIVVLRFFAYIVSAVILWFMVIKAVISLLRG
ncbi:MAG TPA: MAPEG family protein [Gammaproteobacteria bacterium]